MCIIKHICGFNIKINKVQLWLDKYYVKLLHKNVAPNISRKDYYFVFNESTDCGIESLLKVYYLNTTWISFKIIFYQF